MIVAQRARASISRAGLRGGRAEEHGEQDARDGGRHDAKAGTTLAPIMDLLINTPEYAC